MHRYYLAYHLAIGIANSLAEEQREMTICHVVSDWHDNRWLTSHLQCKANMVMKLNPINAVYVIIIIVHLMCLDVSRDSLKQPMKL